VRKRWSGNARKAKGLLCLVRRMEGQHPIQLPRIPATTPPHIYRQAIDLPPSSDDARALIDLKRTIVTKALPSSSSKLTAQTAAIRPTVGRRNPHDAYIASALMDLTRASSQQPTSSKPIISGNRKRGRPRRAAQNSKL
jgi:hypothetical protein